jgi:peptidylprolyl isomerase
MKEAKKGDTVKVHYTGKLEDGTVFDTSVERQPFEFTIGNGNVIAGFEANVVGMAEGAKKSFKLAPEDAYGYPRKELVVEVKKDDFPEHITPELGQKLQLRQADGQPVACTVTEVKENMVTLDANHPLAGKSLTFEVELLEVA